MTVELFKYSDRNSIILQSAFLTKNCEYLISIMITYYSADKYQLLRYSGADDLRIMQKITQNFFPEIKTFILFLKLILIKIFFSQFFRSYVVNVLVKNSPWLLKIISLVVSVKVAIKLFQTEIAKNRQKILRLTSQKYTVIQLCSN